MNLNVRSKTLREIAGEQSRLPDHLRSLLCHAVEAISVDDMAELMDRHESDSANFDGVVEANIRKLDVNALVGANQRISDANRFNNDLVLTTNECCVCVEIEKGYMSRFEFDILKMQAFAARCRREQPEVAVYGAFVVPLDNIVASHISGNSRESSYAYLQRLCRLVVEIDSLLLDDILIVGYGTSLPVDKPEPKRTSGKRKPSKRGSTIISAEAGLLAEAVLEDGLRGYPLDTVFELRRLLAAKCAGICEKFNSNSRYLGYANSSDSDALYVYVQKKKLVIDIRVSVDVQEELEGRGFEVRPRDNYQAKAGWLTGLIVPHGLEELDTVVDLAMEALK
ncbi:MAG: hypothetical protein ABIF82_13005 [Planctomycetota bacterium]